MKNLFKNTNFQTSLILLFLVIAAIFLHSNYINESPMYVHAWAQSDRFSIALNFLKNNFNLFYPESHIHNPQFPNNWQRVNEECISAVNFPIHDYIVAILMKIFNTKEPGIFRTYTLLYSLLGLFYLYKLTLHQTNSQFKAKLFTILAATSPVFIYYQSGFLPSIPSLSNVIIGYYFYCIYLKEERVQNFYLSIFFLTIAVLNRTSFAIPLISLISHQVLLSFSSTQHLKQKISAISLSILSIGGYYLHNLNLETKYGSNFLNELLPPNSWTETKHFFYTTIDNWSLDYFSMLHYYIFGIISIFFLTTFVLGKHISDIHKMSFINLIAIYLCGTMCFSFVMLVQFENHDYYFLDSWFLPLIFLFIGLISFIPSINFKYSWLFQELTLIVLLFFLIKNGQATQNKRYTDNEWDHITKSSKIFEGSKQLLADLKIPKDAKILIIDECAPNIPFIKMDRKGYLVLRITKESIKNALNWEFDYIVFTNEIFEKKIHPEYPELLKHLIKVGENGYISVCRLSDKILNQSYATFFSENSLPPTFSDKLTFETKPESYWSGVNLIQTESISGNRYGYIDSTQEYGFSYSRNDLFFLKQEETILKIDMRIKSKNSDNTLLVFEIFENEKNTYYHSIDLKNMIHSNTIDEWENIVCSYKLPKINSDNFKVSLYFWNKGRNNFYCDDLKLDFY